MYCYIQVQCNKTSIMGLMKTLEAHFTFSVAYFASVKQPSRVVEVIMQPVMTYSSIATDYKQLQNWKMDTYIQSSSWVEGRQQTKRRCRWPGQSRWKWAALPTRTAYRIPALQSHRSQAERDQMGFRGRGGEERKGAFETTGSMCYQQYKQH